MQLEKGLAVEENGLRLDVGGYFIGHICVTFDIVVFQVILGQVFNEE